MDSDTVELSVVQQTNKNGNLDVEKCAFTLNAMAIDRVKGSKF